MASKTKNQTAQTENVTATTEENEAEGPDNGERVFKLSKTKEVAVRFQGDYELRYTLPVAVPGTTVQEVLDGEVTTNVVQTLRNIAERFAPEADFATILVAKINGQGLNLDVQKAAKDYLAAGNKATEGLTVDEALAGATQVMADFRAGTPRARGEGKTGKVAQAEAKAAKAVGTALDMYRALSPEVRATYRPMLISGNMATEAELDAIEAE